MRNETSQSWYFMPLSILLSSLAAKDIRDNLFLGLFIEGVECLPCAAVTGCPLVAWRPCHAFVGQPSDIVSGQICVLGYFLERAGTPPYCAPQQGQVRSVVELSDFMGNPPAIVQRCEKNTLVKAEIAIALKASPNIRTAW